MEIESLRKSTLTGVFWKFFERIFAQLVSLIVSIVLARILGPEHYVSIGIVTIFFNFGNVIITGGLNTALIQKKEADPEDYSSVLCMSLILSIIVYLLLFFFSPLIAKLYNREELILIFRVMGIVLIVNSVKSVFSAYVSNKMQFKKFFFVTLVGTSCSAVVGIVLALKGFGTWALVFQQMSVAIIDTVMLGVFSGIRLRIQCSLERVKRLFKFGIGMFSASVISAVYEEASPLIIGLKFSPTHLSFYDKGKSFPSLINSACNDTLTAVLFPAMAKVQDNKEMILSFTRRFIKVSSFFVFPIMIGFFCIAENFVMVLLSEKWMPSVIYIRIFCIGYLLNFIQTGNLQAIKAIGRSDIILKLEIIKKCIYTAVLLVVVLCAKSPVSLAIVMVINTCFATIVNTYPNKKLIGYRYMYQVKDVFPNLVLACIMGIYVSVVTLLPVAREIELFIQILIGVIVYIGVGAFVRNDSLLYLFALMKKMRGEHV